jgi:hypothetical protein
MPEREGDKQIPPSHLPALRPQTPDAGDAEAAIIKLFKRPSSWWSRLTTVVASVFTVALFLAIALVFVDLMFGRRDILVTPGEPAIPGWEDLASCVDLTSLDGKKDLTLSEKAAEIWDRTEGADDKGRTIKGTWNYEGAKRYALSIHGETTVYTLLSIAEGTACILINGDVRAADLTASWFSFSGQRDEMPD